MGPSSWAPASSGRYSRCSPWSRAGRCRRTGSPRACGATSCRRARRRWCSTTCRISDALLDGDGVRIVTHGRGYELQLPERDVDAVRFERLVGESRPRDALALWHGDALADLTDEPFAAAEIRRLEELRVRAAECAIDADLEAGRHAEVVGELDALVAAYPLREHLHAERMLALYRAGRQSEALAAYREARTALVERDRRRAGRRAAAPARRDPRPRPRARPARGAGRARAAPRAAAAHRGSCCSAPPRCCSPASSAFGRHPRARPRGPAGHRREHGRADRPGQRPHHEADRGRQEPRAPSWTAAGRCGSPTRPTAPSRGSTARDDDRVAIPVGGAPAALAFGGGSLWVADSDVARGRAGRSRRQQGRASGSPVGNAPRSLAVRRRRGVGRVGSRRAHPRSRPRRAAA